MESFTYFNNDLTLIMRTAEDERYRYEIFSK